VTACGGDLVNLLVGRIDPARDPVFQHDLAVEVVRAAGDEAAVLGARIVIEHLNPVDVEAPLLPTPAAAAAFVTAVAHPAVHLLFDAYHAARAGLDPLAEVEPVAHLIGHVQYADSPGRGAPGTGTVDLWALLDRLDAIGYEGRVGLEYVPEGSTAASLAFLEGRPE